MDKASESISVRVLIPCCVGGSLVYGLVNFPIIYGYVNHALLIEYSVFQSICLSLTHSSSLFLSFVLIFRWMLQCQLSGILSAFLMAVFFWFLSSLLFGYSFAMMQPGQPNYLYGIMLFFVLNVVDLAFIFLGILLYLSIDAVMKKIQQIKKTTKKAKEG